MSEVKTNPLPVTKIEVDPSNLIITCPSCGASQEGWVANPLGKASQCDECGAHYEVPAHTPITVRF